MSAPEGVFEEAWSREPRVRRLHLEGLCEVVIYANGDDVSKLLRMLSSLESVLARDAAALYPEAPRSSGCDGCGG